MQHLDQLPVQEVRPGFFGKMLHGEKGTITWWEIKKGSVLETHQHFHEQFTYLMEGELAMIIGGKPCLLTPGMTLVIPSLTPHSAVANSDCKVIDFFSPAREDYQTK